MKKFLLVASALLMMVPLANAQLKSSADQKKVVEAAKANAENPKKAEKAATWMKLGEAYIKAYNDVTGGLQLNQAQMEASLLIQAKPVSQEQVVLGGVPTEKIVYQTVNVYYQNGIIVALEPTDYAYPDGLVEAAKAFVKALSLDAKKDKDVRANIMKINNLLNQSGISWNTLGDNQRSSVDFERAYDVSVAIEGGDPDFDALYNSGLTAWMDKDYTRARDVYTKSVEAGYDAKGEIQAKLGDIYANLGDAAAQKKVLEDGFAKYPENQSILIGLINYADNAGEDPNYILTLLAKAKENDPTNASIYAVEGNILAEMKRFDEAVVAFDESVARDPNYLYAFYAKGKMWYDRGVEIQVEIDNLPLTAPQAQYEALCRDRDEALAKVIDPMEICFEKAVDVQYKVACADVLRRVYYQLGNSENDYDAKSQVYKKYVEENSGE